MNEKIIRKHYLRSFYIITFILSFLLLTLYQIFPNAGRYSVSFAQLSPALAAFLLAFIIKDKTSIKEIKDHFRINPLVMKWMVPALALPCIIIVIISILMTSLKIAFVPWEGNLLFYSLNFVALLIGCAAEEIGWRGFLLPRLQKKYSPLTSSVVVGILWGVWHLNFTGGIGGFVLYTVTIIEMSILMTWIYNKSNGSLFLMTLWHLTINLTSQFLLWNRFNFQLFVVESIVFGILCISLIILEQNAFFSKAGTGRTEECET